MKCVALNRDVDGVTEWLISNGMNMGRWTRMFGVNCLADTVDCMAFIANMHIDHPDTRLHTFEVTEIV
jgi:hypothetical protein